MKIDRAPITPHQVREAMVFTSDNSACWQRYSEKYVFIHSGAYLSVEFLLGLEAPWQKRSAIYLARAIAVTNRRKSLIATGCTAAIIADARVSLLNDDLHFRLRKKVGKSTIVLPAVSLHGKLLAPQSHVKIHHLPWARYKTAVVAGMKTDFSLQTSLISTVIHDPIYAHEIVSRILRALSNFDPWIQEISRTACEKQRAKLYELLKSLPARTRGKRRARWALRFADPGCDSPGEARLLALLCDAGFRGMVTQHHVSIGIPPSEFFLDIAFPEHMLALEFDGRAKFGTNIDDFHQAEEAQIRRQRLLESYGWTVIRVRWTDFKDPQGIIRQVDHHLTRSLGAKIDNRGA